VNHLIASVSDDNMLYIWKIEPQIVKGWENTVIDVVENVIEQHRE